jgi:hypothetical protein
MSVGVQVPVVVAGVGPGKGDAVVAAAASEAVDRRAGLRIVHVVPAPARPGPVPAPAGTARRIEAMAAGIRTTHPELTVDVEVATGDPVTELLCRTRGCVLLVVGHDQRLRRRRAVRSVAVDLTDRADVPVLVCPTGGGVPVGSSGAGVLVGVDGAADDAVLAFAFGAADARHVPVVAEHVWSTAADAVPARAGAGADPAGERTAAGASARMLRAAVRPWADRYRRMAVRHVTRHGLDAAIALSAAARTAELVVIGAHHGRSGGGAVRRALLHRVGCPLAVVPVAATVTAADLPSRGGGRSPGRHPHS